MLAEEIAALLRAHVGSYEHLAVLLLSHAEPARAWSVEELSDNLQIGAPLAASAAADLCASGLLRLAAEGAVRRYRFAATGATAAAIGRLADEYAQNPVGVIKFLSANAINRLRTAALRAFADAFVLKKKDGDGG